MKKLALGIDYSNICYRSLFTCRYGNPDIKNFDTKEECDVFVRKVCTDIAYIARLFQANSVYLLVDSKHPWRNDITGDYKANRKKDDTLNMTNIYKSMEDLLEILKSRGFFSMAIDRAEADDLAALFKKHMYEDSDTNIVFATADADWLQLIGFNPNTTQYTVVFNPIANNKGTKVLSCTPEFMKWIQEENKSDIFFTNYNPTKEKILNITNKDSKIKFQEVLPMEVLLKKIMCGDDGDNVPTFYDYMKNGKKVRITENRLIKIREECPFNDVVSLNECTKSGKLKDAIIKVMKDDVDTCNMVDRLNRQRMFVELNTELFPKHIVDGFDLIKSELDNARVYEDMFKMEAIVKGTKYEPSLRQAKSNLNSIFKGFIDVPVNKTNSLF